LDPYRKALAARDTEETLRLLQEASRANPRLAEAWYEPNNPPLAARRVEETCGHASACAKVECRAGEDRTDNGA
jgi:hypothetical protein